LAQFFFTLELVELNVGCEGAHTKDKNTTLTLSVLFEADNLKRRTAPTTAKKTCKIFSDDIDMEFSFRNVQ